MPLPAGTRLGPYEIAGLLGAGGMGEVYKGRDTRLSRTVAIKVLPALLHVDPVARERFEREALRSVERRGADLVARRKADPVPIEPRRLQPGVCERR